MYEERNVFGEEMRKIDGCDSLKLGTLDSSSEKTIAVLGDWRWPQTAKQQGDTIRNKFKLTYGNTVVSTQRLAVGLTKVRNGAPSRTGCVVNGQMTSKGIK